MFRYYAWKYPGKVSANICYSDALSRRIYAAADAFLVPSAFEPCGLTQLISLRYGAVPIVHETGGLKDTVKPYNPMENTGTGFSFAGYSADELLGRIQHALFVFNSERDHWDQMVERGMKEDWSWNNSSKIYMDSLAHYKYRLWYDYIIYICIIWRANQVETVHVHCLGLVSVNHRFSIQEAERL